MSEDEKQDLAEAFDRVTAAVAGRPDKGYSGVIAGDVVLIGSTIAEADHHPHTRDLLKGAKGADPKATVYQEAGKLRRLLGKVKIAK